MKELEKKMKIEILLVCFGMTGIYAFHTKKWDNTNSVAGRRKWTKTNTSVGRNFDAQNFMSDFINNIAGMFNIRKPKLKYPRTDFRRLKPGQAKTLKDGSSRGVVFRSRRGNSGAFAFSSGNGKGFSMISDGSSSGNILVSSNGNNKGGVSVSRSKSLPLFGRNGLISKLFQNL